MIQSSLKRLFIGGLCCLFSSSVAIAETIIIENINLIDPSKAGSPVEVSLLIKDGELALVSQDPIQAKKGTEVYDAAGGYILARLKVGHPATIIILDDDPRENFELLLDTKEHASFAMNQGEVVRSRLSTRSSAAATPTDPELSSSEEALTDESSPDETKPGWFAYTPPPFALPIAYDDHQPFNHFETNWTKGAFVLAAVLDSTQISPDEDTKSAVGPFDESGGGEVRGVRFGVVGALKLDEPWIYTFFAATNSFDSEFLGSDTDQLTMFDYRLDIPMPAQTTLSVGKQKEPISMERLMSLAFQPQQERSSASDAFLPSRNVGISWSGNAFEQQSSWAIGVFNNWFDDNTDFEQSATQGVGRVTWVPWKSADESNLVHLGLGLRYSDAKEGVRYFTEPEVNTLPIYADTGLIDANYSVSTTLEASWRKGPLWLGAEYTRSDVDSTASGGLAFDGYHVTASYILTGEMRDYRYKSGTFGPIPIARPGDLGGLGVFEPSLRYSHLDLNDGPIQGGKTDIWSAAMNWWPRKDLNMSVNYRYIQLEKNGFEGNTHALVSRITFLIE
ncbi:OprO/OprP family phosphate-selective porin [Coraliomargarita akajimensis]|uniref:Phosphate-selective porin O and P n=1 Tax=Coraliomargarita akajimensis (strain DSM 45221 / IAM 15411 / JCM 23193 / KCTC 12865 / 04OKA010-24) TaxID=583355 RepID=D5EPC6_CORAD|nr:phosphate porin [Coraliomargarita akajimensis]ADE55636.1 phosphate-selective porin O and P [Coraliomargarita akajimensis DSM 45221]